MKKLKQILIVITSAFLFNSCSNSSSSNGSSEPTLIGKWAFGQDTGCGRNSIEFKNSNLFIEYHYNNDCSNSSYNGQYTRVDNNLTINGTQKVIVELTNTTLTLYTPSTDLTKTYDRVN